jgi:hypothetical protein
MSIRFSNRTRPAVALFFAAVPLLVSLAVSAQVAPKDPARWEPAIKAFEEQDLKHPFPKGEIVFVGASSIVRTTGRDNDRKSPSTKSRPTKRPNPGVLEELRRHCRARYRNGRLADFHLVGLRLVRVDGWFLVWEAGS